VPTDEVIEATNSRSNTMRTKATIMLEMAKVRATIMRDKAKPVWLHAERRTHSSLMIKSASKGN
jgi:hypothetical protein